MNDEQPLAKHLQEKIEALRDGQNIILEGADLYTKTGYIQLPKFVFYDPRLNDAARSCYALITHYAFNNNRTMPGQTQLTDFWGVHRNTVSNAMSLLEELGYIHRIRRYGRMKDLLSISYTVSEYFSNTDEVPTPIAFDRRRLTYGPDQELATEGFRLNKPDNADMKSQGGWIEVPALLYSQAQFPNINDHDRSVYVVLLDYAHGKGTCFPSQELIGQRLGAALRTIENRMAKLKAAGLIEVARRKDSLANIYNLNLKVKKRAEG